MNFFFDPRADEEFDVAVGYYEDCQIGLGMEFAEEVYATIQRIVEFPEAWRVISTNSRCGLVHRFPYGVVYQVKDGVLRIIAIANLHREPGYWKSRI